VKQLTSLISAWSRSILKSIPYQLKALIGYGQRYSVIESQDSNFIISQFYEGQFSNSTEVNSDNSERVIKNFDGEQILVIPDDDIISLNLSLPKSALRSLDQLLEEEIQRLTPFSFSEVRMAHEITSSGGGQINLLVNVIQKSKFNTIKEKAEAIGLQPTIAIVDIKRIPEVQNINFLVDEAHSRKPKARFPTKPIAFAILLVTAIASPFLQRAVSIQELEIINSKLKNKVSIIQNERAELDILKNESETIKDFSQNQYTVIELLNLISDAVPDTAWLTRFSAKDNIVTIHGFAADSSKVLTGLGRVSKITAPTFTSPIVKDISRNIEQFQITAKLAW
jgi:general secretion pathway protein L